MTEMDSTAKRLNRRRFLLGTAGVAGTAILAACGGNASGTSAPAATTASGAATTASGAATTAATRPPSATTAAGSATTAPAATTGTTGAAQTTPNVPPSGAVTINWFAARDTTGYRVKQVDEFNRTNKTLQISYQEQGADTTSLHDKFVTVATAKDSSADMVSMDVPFVPEFAAAGWTIPVDDVVAGGEKEKFFKGTIDGATYNGKLYGVPWFNNGPGLYYRKDLFDAKGLKPPKTYAELLAAAKALQTPEVAGFVEQLAQTEGGVINWMEKLWGLGGDLVDDKLNVVVDKRTAGVDGLQLLLDWVYKDKILPEAALQYKQGADVINQFRSGGAAMIRLWYSNVSPLYAADSKLKPEQWDIVALPSKDGAQPGPGCLGDWNLGVSTYSKKPKETIEVIKILTGLEQQTKAFMDGAFLPARPAVFDNPDIQKKYPYAKSAQTSFASLKPRPVTPFYPQMSADALQPNFGAVMARSKYPDQAIKDMADKMRQILKA